MKNPSATKPYTIALMLGNLVSDHAALLLRSYSTCAERAHVNLVIVSGPQAPQYCNSILSTCMNADYTEQFTAIYHSVRYLRPDAIIVNYGTFSALNHTMDLSTLLKQLKDIPYLVVSDVPENSSIPHIVTDNYGSMMQCMDHLLSLHGYTRIAFLAGPPNNHDSNERLQAYQDAMAQAGIPVRPSMVAYGDYTELVTSQVNALLEHNPGLEAIVCANDNMAKCCYDVCMAHHMEVGRDIAITGFDDVEFTRTLDPPLTSISQDSFSFAYESMEAAIALCRGDAPRSKKIPAYLHLRGSCGCRKERPDLPAGSSLYPQLQEDLMRSAGELANDLFCDMPYPDEKAEYQEHILHFYKSICTIFLEPEQTHFDVSVPMHLLQQLLDYPFLSDELLLKCLTKPLQELLLSPLSATILRELQNFILNVQQYIHARESEITRQQAIRANQRFWFVPAFTADLVGANISWQDALHKVMTRLQALSVPQCFFLLFDKPIPYKHDYLENTILPEYLFLSAFYNRSTIQSYPAGHQPIIRLDQHLPDNLKDPGPHCYSTFALFSSDEQFGIMVCETTSEDLAFIQACSIQIGSLLRSLELHGIERAAKQELEKSMKTIQEKNHILSFISEYDELSGLLNRRGFMERAIAFCRTHAGERASLIFCDLDHLKQINDTFGHGEGDFALKKLSSILAETMSSDAITARIGGDEFLVLTLSHQEGQDLSGMIRNKAASFNATSDKPYYVETSIGIHSFTCEPELDINQIIRYSDDLLYLAKKNRRTNICKSRP